jgi:tetratricopeptide (TPR) repeat protein
MDRRRMSPCSWCAIVFVLAAVQACSHDEAPAPAGLHAASPAPPPVVARPHAHTPELDALRKALDRGDRAAATALLPAASATGAEEPLLRARFAALDPTGTMEALRVIETARAADPKDPDVYATAAEIYAAHGSFETAWLEIERGEKACGATPELVRARGVTWICRENGATKGLAELERARSMDPDLPFADHALAQAHLLVAKQEEKDKKIDSALAHARASLGFDPSDIDARRLLSELQATHGDFESSIATLEALVKDGQPLGAELASMHKKAAMAALLEHDRPRALEHFELARAQGLSDAELGTGARLLLEEASSRIDRGVAAYEKGDLYTAETLFRSALRCDPTSLAARNHLAVVLYGDKRCAEAATLWQGVITDARAESIELPEPVHLNLAGAQRCAGDLPGACATLAEYLRLEPQGEWAERTRTLLDRFQKDRDAK